MNIAGKPLDAEFVSPYLLIRADGTELELQLSPLSLGFQRKLRQRGLQPPQPPLKILRDSSGKPLRDAVGQVVTHPDLHESQYLLALELYHQRVALFAILEALRNDPAISFDTPQPTPQAAAEEWLRFVDQLFEEFEQAGFTMGDLKRLSTEICRLSNLLDKHLQETQSHFSAGVGR